MSLVVFHSKRHSDDLVPQEAVESSNKKQRINKNKAFIEHPTEDIAEFVLSWIDSIDAIYMGQVSRSWRNSLVKQLTFSLKDCASVPQYLYELGILVNGKEELISLDALQTLDQEASAKQAFILANKLFSDLAINPKRNAEVLDVLNNAIIRIRKQLLVPSLEALKKRTLEKGLKILEKFELITKKAARTSVVNLGEDSETILNIFKKMVPYVKSFVLSSAAQKEDLELARLLINTEMIPGIKKMSPPLRGKVLLDAASAKEDNSEMVSFILNSGPIQEGEILEQEGFSEDDSSMRSRSIYAAVRKGHEEVVETLLKHKPILGIDNHLGQALYEAVAGSEYEITKLLLDYLDFPESIIREAQTLIGDDPEILNLLVSTLHQVLYAGSNSGSDSDSDSGSDSGSDWSS